MIQELKQLQELLSKFEKADASERKAAISLVTRWASRTKLLGYSAEQLYRAVSVASAQRRPEDLELLRQISELGDVFPSVATAAKEELSLSTALFAGVGGRRQM